MSQLQAVDLQKQYYKRKVVDGVSLNLNSGEVVGLLGPNGAGKTTSFYMIVGLVQADQGRIYLDREELT
ncbi:MAG: ATP-binding cassette domain-containing protein, partial [Candidatus Thiodiazotropha taylori]|nr:ATP-binding cassette domain-containing protein [Candidatus Thiodiazotropha taylori]MCW4251194.1 ATP-binding cassette domain-containing protein [Candidatus Thiodiazotropha taylori]